MMIETVSENNLNDNEKEVHTHGNTVTYGIVKEIYSSGGLERTSYGIAVYSNREENSTATIISSINDITPNYSAISELVEKLNRHNASPIHLSDIVEDFIS